MKAMGLALAVLPLGLVAGCRDSPPAAADRIEIRVSGWSAVDVAVDRAGRGRFRLGDPPPEGRKGTFALTPAQFQALARRLERYRRQAVPATDESAREFIERRCPEGLPEVTDSGAVYIRWVGPGSARHFLADLGCDPERQESRNSDLLDLVQSLPVPLDR